MSAYNLMEESSQPAPSILVDIVLELHIVGNRAKGRKRVLQKKQSTPSFPKTEHF